MSDETDRRDGLDLAATAALALYSFVAALGFARVFGDWEFVADVAVVVLVGHGLSLLLRRLAVPGVLAVGLTAVALAWTIAWLAYPSTFAAIFPTRETWDIALADLDLVRDQFQTAVAPVEYVGGWALLATIGTAFVVLAADTFAFRAHARGEALVPGAVLFVFVAALGADRHRVVLTLLLVAAGVLAAALLRVRFAQPPRTVLGPARNPLSIAVPAAVLAGTAVVAGAWVLGPRLPGAGAEALVETHNQSGGVTEVVSPLVDIRSRLVNRANVELFVVRATAPAYWRATGLPSSTARSGACPTTARSTTSTASCQRPHRGPARTSSSSSSARCAASSCRRPPSRSPPRARACAGTPRRRRWCAPTATSRPGTASRWSRRCPASRRTCCGRRPRPSPPIRSTSSSPPTSPTPSAQRPRR